MTHNIIIKHHDAPSLPPDRVRWCSFNGVILGGLLILSAAAGGCQRGPAWELVLVEGTITRAGKPLAGVRVTFLADVEANTQGPQTSGITDDAGHYRLRTDGGKPGAAIGQYRVCIDDPRLQILSHGTRVREKRLPSGDPIPEANSRIPDTYTSFRTTPLRAEVRPGGMQTLDFDIP